MDRVLRLRQLWNWIPAFRAVAESENLHTAARMVHVTPSSLSRMIRLLEGSLGKQLFYRDGRRLALTAEGTTFLGFVRDAMRRLDDGLQALDAEALTGSVVVAATPFLSETLVLPALRALRLTQPGLVPRVQREGVDHAAKALLRGDIDAAVLFKPRAGANIVVEALGSMTSGVYCGPLHPLFRSRTVTREELLRHPFVAPDAREDDNSDQWPPAVRRQVALYVSDIHLALSECAEGTLLSVLPDRYAASSGRRLKRLSCEVALPPTEVHLLRRKKLEAEDRVDLLLREMGALLPSAVRSPDTGSSNH